MVLHIAAPTRPKIRLDKPLSQGYHSCWLPSESADMQNYGPIGFGNSSPDDWGTQMVCEPSELGAVVRRPTYGGAGNHGAILHTGGIFGSLGSPTYATWHFKLRRISGAGSAYVFGDIGASRFSLYMASGNQWGIYIGGTWRTASIGAWAVGQWYDIFVSYNPDRTNGWNIHIDGVLEYELNAAKAEGSGGKVAILGTGDQSGSAPNGQCPIIQAWTQPLSAAQMVDVMEDPFLLVRPKGFIQETASLYPPPVVTTKSWFFSRILQRRNG